MALASAMWTSGPNKGDERLFLNSVETEKVVAAVMKIARVSLRFPPPPRETRGTETVKLRGSHSCQEWKRVQETSEVLAQFLSSAGFGRMCFCSSCLLRSSFA